MEPIFESYQEYQNDIEIPTEIPTEIPIETPTEIDTSNINSIVYSFTDTSDGESDYDYPCSYPKYPKKSNYFNYPNYSVNLNDDISSQDSDYTLDIYSPILSEMEKNTEEQKMTFQSIKNECQLISDDNVRLKMKIKSYILVNNNLVSQLKKNKFEYLKLKEENEELNYHFNVLKKKYKKNVDILIGTKTIFSNRRNSI